MSLLKTYLQNIRADHPSNNDRDERRITQTGALTAVLAMTKSPSAVLRPDLQKKAIGSQGRTLEIPVTKKGSVTIANVRSCTIAGGNTESDMVTVTWKTISSDIFMVPGQYQKNIIGYTFDLQQKIDELVEAWKVEIETDLITALDANKSQVYASSIVTDKYALVGDAIQVTEAQKNLYWNDLDAINFADDFYNPTMKVIANHVVMPVVTHYINQGSGNDTNTNYQFAGKHFTFTNRITNGALKLATGFFMPDGSMGMLSRVDVDAMMSHDAKDGTEWREDTLPDFPFPVGVQYKSSCGDQSALNGTGLEHLEATKVERFQFSVDYAIIVPYNTDLATKTSSIRKFEFVA